jgi:hypothetical protein
MFFCPDNGLARSVKRVEKATKRNRLTRIDAPAMTALQGEGTIMVPYDFAYLQQRATVERSFAERADNPYVKACHKRLARRYEEVLASLLEVPRDWPVTELNRAG